MEEKKDGEKDKPKELSKEEIARKKKVKRQCCCLVASFVGLLIITGIVIYGMFKGGDGDSYIPFYKGKNSTSNQNPTGQNNSSSTGTQDQTGDSGDTGETSDSSTPTTDTRMIDFFIETTLRDTTGHVIGAGRWTKNPVTVGLAEGTLDGVMSAELDSYISDFNGQSGTIRLQRVNGPGDIKIYSLSPAEINTLSGGLTDGGFSEYVSGDSCTIIEGRVYVSNDPGNVTDMRKYLVRHEMNHAIGFHGHSDIYPESIMFFASEGYSFPEVDKKAIQMLYNSNLPLCANEAKVRDMYK